MNDEYRYLFFKKLDDQERIAGLPIDELLPCAFVALVTFLMGHALIALVLAVCLRFVIVHLKKGQGSGWLLCLMYWHLPGGLMKVVLNATPSSSDRHFIS